MAPHKNTSHSTTSHFITILHYITRYTLYITLLYNTTLLHYITLHYTLHTLHSTQLQMTALSSDQQQRRRHSGFHGIYWKSREEIKGMFGGKSGVLSWRNLNRVQKMWPAANKLVLWCKWFYSGQRVIMYYQENQQLNRLGNLQNKCYAMRF